MLCKLEVTWWRLGWMWWVTAKCTNNVRNIIKVNKGLTLRNNLRKLKDLCFILERKCQETSLVWLLPDNQSLVTLMWGKEKKTFNKNLKIQTRIQMKRRLLFDRPILNPANILINVLLWYTLYVFQDVFHIIFTIGVTLAEFLHLKLNLFFIPLTWIRHQYFLLLQFYYIRTEPAINLLGSWIQMMLWVQMAWKILSNMKSLYCFQLVNWHINSDEWLFDVIITRMSR